MRCLQFFNGGDVLPTKVVKCPICGDVLFVKVDKRVVSSRRKYWPAKVHIKHKDHEFIALFDSQLHLIEVRTPTKENKK